MKKLLTLILFFSFISVIYSYENDLFYINIPNDYIEKINDNSYTWSKDNIFITIVVHDNKDNYNVRDFTQKDINKQKDYIINTYKEKLLNYKVEPIINNMRVINDNSSSYLEYDLFFESKSIIGHDIYQKCRMYTTDNHVYLITLNDENEISDNKISIINSFKVKDSYLKNTNYKLYIILLSLFGSLLLYLDYIISKKRHK